MDNIPSTNHVLGNEYSPYWINVRSTKLSERERMVATYINEHCREVIHMSITEVAEKCDVSEATLVRLSKKLGYKGFQALKIRVAQDSVEPYLQFHENLSVGDSAKVIAQKILFSYARTLNDTLSIVDEKKMHDAAQCIAGAKKVMFIAAGGSQIVAEDSANKLLRIGIPAYAFADYNTQKMLASLLSADDVVIAISHSGASISTLETLSVAKEVGTKIIIITNFGRSPIQKYGDICLFTSSAETAYKSEALASRVAQIALLDILMTIVSFSNDKFYYDNMQKTRRALDNTKI